mmetsp:Transcript_15911/g.29116  ORF Transcript_15911/g.29116 Transcript_15911/m.29116 type:complete len:229 (+) Transcript_15911:112-798(+)
MSGECTLFGAFGWLIQGLLGILCFSSLILKRYRERPRRSWTIFGMDAMKQAISAGVAHIMNVLIAYLMSEWDSENQCVWYFVNIIIDCSFGVLISYLLLRCITAAALRCGLERLRSGDYLQLSDKPDVKAWLMQLGVWMLIVLFVKWVLVGIIYLLRDYLSDAGAVVLSPVAFEPKLELVIVMVVVPCFMNVIQFWVQDSFLKGRVEREPGKSMFDLASTKETIDVIN